MSDMKCPFCQQNLKDQWLGQNVAHEYFDCPKCKMNGNPKLWQELIRTRKALEIAKNAINSAADHNIINCVARGIDPRTDDVSVTLCNALERITALTKGGDNDE